MENTKEEVILVDSTDRPIGVMEKMQAHLQGRLHRAFSVFLFNDQNQILLQRRAFHKYHSGGLWSNTCCSHPKPGEKTTDAVHRRLQEEMGISCPVFPVFQLQYHATVDNGLQEHEFDHIYVGHYSGIPNINQNEVADWLYCDLDDLRIDMNRRPESYSKWFRIALPQLLEKMPEIKIPGSYKPVLANI